MTSEQMSAVMQAMSGISVSQRVRVCGRSNDCLLHFGNVSDWGSVNMAMGQRCISRQVASISVSMSQTIGSDSAIVSGNWCHMLCQRGVGRNDRNGVMSISMSISVRVGVSVSIRSIGCMSMSVQRTMAVTVSQMSVSQGQCVSVRCVSVGTMQILC